MSLRIKLILQYCGTSYQGWQSQPHGNTIQQILEQKLSTILRVPIGVIVSGRTDAGVHALEQVCHFDLPDHLKHWVTFPLKTSSRNRPPVKCLPLYKLHYSLNEILPAGIVITDLSPVAATFHAQFSAKKKQYSYFILNSPIRNPFLDAYSWRIPYPLDFDKMQKAANILIGEHDFKSFCAADSTVKTTTRKIYRIKIEAPRKARTLGIFERQGKSITYRSLTSWKAKGMRQLDPFYDRQKGGHVGPPLQEIFFEGNGFLKHMVRTIVGTLVDVGRKKINLNDVKNILKSADRKKAGMTAPAKGLFLKKVIY